MKLGGGNSPCRLRLGGQLLLFRTVYNILQGNNDDCHDIEFTYLHYKHTFKGYRKRAHHKEYPLEEPLHVSLLSGSINGWPISCSLCSPSKLQQLANDFFDFIFVSAKHELPAFPIFP